MTTLKQLDRCARDSLSKSMRRRGFAVEEDFCFWRKRGPLFDLLMPQILTGGDLLRINVTVWSPWIDSESGEFLEFPPKYCLIGGTLSPEFPERMRDGHLFDIGTEVQVNATLQNIQTLVDDRVLDWFGSISSANAYAEHVGDKGFHPTEERAAQIVEGVRRGFLQEKWP